MEEEKKWINVVGLEKETGIPSATIRRYINNHGHHLNVNKKGKAYFIAAESIPIMLEVRKLYEEGKTIQQVNDTLVEQAIPMTITISEGEQKMSVHVGEALQDLKKSMDAQNEIIRSLGEQMKKQQAYIDEKLEARDQRLIEALKESMESRRQIASSKEDQPEKKSFWARLFG